MAYKSRSHVRPPRHDLQRRGCMNINLTDFHYADSILTLGEHARIERPERVNYLRRKRLSAGLRQRIIESDVLQLITVLSESGTF